MQGKTEFERTMLAFVKEQLEFNKKISDRLETVIIKNNLIT